MGIESSGQGGRQAGQDKLVKIVNFVKKTLAVNFVTVFVHHPGRHRCEQNKLCCLLAEQTGWASFLLRSDFHSAFKLLNCSDVKEEEISHNDGRR